MLVFFAIFRPVTTIKTLQKYFYLVEEVLNFDSSKFNNKGRNKGSFQQNW